MTAGAVGSGSGGVEWNSGNLQASLFSPYFHLIAKL